MTMTLCRIVVLCTLAAAARCIEDWTFPPGFKFGSASAAYQVEGAWNVSDKGENIWDRYTHDHPEKIGNRSNGDVACDSYHLWKRDIEMMTELGLDFYRFSISWSRLLPNGFATYISKDGKEYYNNLIEGVLSAGIEPVVTMHHFDLPQVFQDLGGWTNPFIVDVFADYARVLYTLYGDRVKIWITINEPLSVCDISYNIGNLAPGIVDPELGSYLCNKYILLAHAKAYRIYDNEFRSKYNGEVSIVNHLIWFEPATVDQAELAELAIENCAGRYSHPIFSKEGGWPPSIEKLMLEKSKDKGYSVSILPAFTQEELELVRGTYDFYAMNHYTSRIITNAKDGEHLKPWPIFDAPDLNATLRGAENWTVGVIPYFKMYPQGIRRLLVWLKKRYGDMKFLITENGFVTKSGLNDQTRIDYYEAYLKQVLLAIREDLVNVTHYTSWTIMDNFEWMHGYGPKFGLYEVNFTDPRRTRTPRASAKYYANVIRSHSLNVPRPHV